MIMAGRNNVVTVVNVAAACLFFALILACQACTLGKGLRTETVKSMDTTGTYTLILFGGNHLNDLETVAFLDKEGDAYTFEPYSPDFLYEVIRGMDPKDAFAAAEKFVRFHPAFHGEQMAAILAEQGNVIGYELRPLYMPLAFGTDDVLDIYYRLKDGKVIITVRLKPSVETMQQDGFREESLKRSIRER
jgi:hypothetical protein